MDELEQRSLLAYEIVREAEEAEPFEKLREALTDLMVAAGMVKLRG